MVEPSGPQLARAVLEAKDRFQIQICYCSVYDDCWIARVAERDPKPVARLPGVRRRGGVREGLRRDVTSEDEGRQIEATWSPVARSARENGI